MRRAARIASLFIAVAFILTFAKFTTGSVPAKSSDAWQRIENSIVLYIDSPIAIENGRQVNIDPGNSEIVPVLRNGTTFIPVRFIAESLGGLVAWDDATATAEIDYFGHKINIIRGSSEMTVDGAVTELGVPVEDMGGRLCIPLRKFVQALGKKVFYERGLIIIGDREDLFDRVTEKKLIDEIISGVNNLPVVGTPEKLKELVSNALQGEGYIYGGMTAKRTESWNAALTDTAAAAVSQNMSADAAVKPESAGDSAGYSSTNIQVEGVDEGDVVKTDGQYIYQVNKNRIAVLKAYPAEEMELASTVDFTGLSFVPAEIYLQGKKLVVIGNSNPGYNLYKTPEGGTADRILPGYWSNTVKIIIYDASNPYAIKQVREMEMEGSYVSSRKTGSYLYIITNKGIDYRIVENASEDFLPFYRDSAVKDGYTAITCQDIRYFPGFSDPGFMMLASVNIDDDGSAMKVSTYLGAGQNIYASQEHLYIAVTRYGTSNAAAGIDSAAKSNASLKPVAMPAYREINTLVYKFLLSSGDMSYLCKGEVPGTILNQFSMDENGKYFRIATTKGEVWRSDGNTSRNNVYILDEMLSISGKLEDIAPGEKIYSTRFMGDRLYMVTFKKVDPLFVIDLKEPSSPKILGALKIPGYSDYLHPYDENHIIGFGKDTVEIPQKDPSGKEVGTSAFYQGMKIALFDVSDVNNPVQKFSEIIGDRGTDSELLSNHKALLFSREKNLLAFPVTVAKIKTPSDSSAGSFPQYGDFEFQGAYIYSIDADKGFTLKGRITHMSREDYLKSGNSWYQSDKNVQRILFIDDILYTLSNSAVKANNISDLQERNTVQIP